MPRPGSHVIHPDWEQRHRPTATATMTAQCVIDREDPDGTPVFDPIAGVTTRPRITVYTGPCRVQRRSVAESERQSGDQEVTTADYLVVIEHDAEDVQVADRVTIGASSDPTLTGHALTVASVMRGSLRFERDLTCVDDLG